MSALACVCRRAWNITIGRPSDRQARRQSRKRLSGDNGDPFGLLNSSASASGFPRRSASRSSSCRRQCVRSTTTALGGNEIVPRPCFDLGGLKRSSLLAVSSSERSTDAPSKSTSPILSASSFLRRMPVAKPSTQIA